MGRIFLIFLTATSILCILIPATAQSFTRAVPCPNDASISGYTTITALNTDMQNELNRIGSILPEERDPRISYVLRLCPGETFDASVEGPILPVLNNLQIVCGNSDSTCTIAGGETQVSMFEPTVAGYIQENVLIEGIIFEGFTLSVSVEASLPAMLSLSKVVWQVGRRCLGISERNPFLLQATQASCFIIQNFVDARFIVATFGVVSPMTIAVRDSVVQVGTGFSLLRPCSNFEHKYALLFSMISLTEEWIFFSRFHQRWRFHFR
jgi:hypothetical protein